MSCSTLTRRRFVATSGAALAIHAAPAIAAQQTATTPPSFSGVTVRVLAVEPPISDIASTLGEILSRWGTSTAAYVDLRTIPERDLDATITTLDEVGAWPDLILSPKPLLHHTRFLQSVAPILDALSEDFGTPIDLALNAGQDRDSDPVALITDVAPAVLLFQRSIWERYGQPQGPLTWNQLIETGSQIWNEEGKPVGIGIAPEPSSERVAVQALMDFDALTIENDRVVLVPEPTAAAIDVLVRLVREASTIEAARWPAGYARRLLNDGVASIISDDLTALRMIGDQTLRDDIALGILSASESDPLRIVPAWMRCAHVPMAATTPNASASIIRTLIENGPALTTASQFATRPVFGSIMPNLSLGDGPLMSDPLAPNQPDRIQVLAIAPAWLTWPGAPDGGSRIISEAMASFTFSGMARSVVLNDHSIEQGIRAAQVRLDEIAQH